MNPETPKDYARSVREGQKMRKYANHVGDLISALNLESQTLDVLTNHGAPSEEFRASVIASEAKQSGIALSPSAPRNDVGWLTDSVMNALWAIHHTGKPKTRVVNGREEIQKKKITRGGREIEVPDYDSSELKKKVRLARQISKQFKIDMKIINQMMRDGVLGEAPSAGQGRAEGWLTIRDTVENALTSPVPTHKGTSTLVFRLLEGSLPFEVRRLLIANYVGLSKKISRRFPGVDEVLKRRFPEFEPLQFKQMLHELEEILLPSEGRKYTPNEAEMAANSEMNARYGHYQQSPQRASYRLEREIVVVKRRII